MEALTLARSQRIDRLIIRANRLPKPAQQQLLILANQLAKTIDESFLVLARSLSESKFDELEQRSVELAILNLGESDR